MINKIIDQKLISKVKELFTYAKNIVIVAHVGPDGDALGSSLGLWHYFNQKNKTTTVIYPSQYPNFIGWMSGAEKSLIYTLEKEKADKVIEQCDLIIAVDFNTPSRLDTLSEAIIKSNAEKIMIDHHLYPDINFANLIISHPEVASTSELIFRLLYRMEGLSVITKECAEVLYTGMMTDTGGFTYNSNNQDIYIIISELLKKGIDKDLIYRKVFNTFSTNRIRLQGYCIYEKMKVYPKYRTALITLSEKEKQMFDYQNGDAEGFVNIPLSIKDVIFSVFMREDSDKIKISLRSQGTFPSNQFAKSVFNGGGHLNASGGESTTTLEETVKKFEESLPLYEKELLK